MSISAFNYFSMSKLFKIQWFFHDFFIFTNFKNFSWNSMIFPWSWNRSEFQWFFKSCGNPGFILWPFDELHYSGCFRNKKPSTWIFESFSCWMVLMKHQSTFSGPTFIKADQLDPWIKDQIKITLLPTISHLLLPNFVSCGRACPSHMTQNLVTVGAKLWTADCFLVDPWSMDYADPVW